MHLIVVGFLEWQVVIASSGWRAGCGGWLWRRDWLLRWLLILLHGLLLVTLLRVSALRLECALWLLVTHVLTLGERGDPPCVQPVEEDHATLGVRPFPALEVKINSHFLTNSELVYQCRPVVCQLE